MPDGMPSSRWSGLPGKMISMRRISCGLPKAGVENNALIRLSQPIQRPRAFGDRAQIVQLAVSDSIRTDRLYQTNFIRTQAFLHHGWALADQFD